MVVAGRNILDLIHEVCSRIVKFTIAVHIDSQRIDCEVCML